MMGGGRSTAGYEEWDSNTQPLYKHIETMKQKKMPS